jgi:hypothetical protein
MDQNVGVEKSPHCVQQPRAAAPGP